jgi:uncharacterized membrane protein
MAFVVATPRGLERLVVFADAVVAIAITLLVLPLVEIPRSDKGATVGQMLSDHLGEIGTFFLSFVVISRLWTVHHRAFEHVRLYDQVLLRLTMLWLVTVVFLPLPTELLGSGSSRGAVTLYIGTLLASSLVLEATIEWVHAHPGLQVAGSEMEPLRPGSWAYPLLFAVALGIAAINAHAGLWALLLLLLAGPVDALLLRLRGRRPRASET